MLEALKEMEPEVEVLYLGTTQGAEKKLVEEQGLSFQAISAGRIRERGPVELARNVAALGKGVVESTKALRSFDPDAVFATGGFASVPVGVAARIVRKPLVVFLPDVAPGWAVRLEARLARRLATSSEAALEHLPRSKTKVTGYPVRPAYWSLDRLAARKQLDLPPDGNVVLISGASTGSVALNQHIIDHAPRLLERAMLLHLTGAAEEARVREAAARLDPDQQARWRIHGFLADMPAAMHAADLAVMRSGASVLGELPAATLPAVLVPYPHAGGHQRLNAQFLAGRGCAVTLPEEGLAGLCGLVEDLLGDGTNLEAMRASLERLQKPRAAAELADLVRQVAA
jgi:UDP-N-acetylglucosamine--N-acetylmuramyl-(pentapeptide) pyrophosphoryl-undecaprenol N-acetylglucosamine transferase